MSAKLVFGKKHLLPAISAILLTACSSAPIGVNRLTGSTEVADGEEARIYWDFANASYVRVDGFPEDFSPNDSLSAYPRLNTRYRIVAYNGSDSSENFWPVQVYIHDSAASGPLAMQILPASDSESSYLRGVQNISASKPVNIKVVRHHRLADEKNLMVRAIPLDGNGNFVSGLADERWDLSFACGNDTVTVPLTAANERQLSPEELPLNIGICLDRSAIAKKYFSGEVDAVEEFSAALPPEDHISLTVYNHDIQTFPLRSRSDFSTALNTARISQASGLSAMYKAAFATLNELRAMPQDAGVLVIVSAGSDNASIVYTPEDVIDAARGAGIPVYTIRLGDASDNFAMKYMASATGGKFYYLEEGNEDRIPEILGEIAHSQRIFYEMKAAIPAGDQNCAEEKGRLVLNAGNASLNDSFILPLKTQDNYTRYQALATFSYRDTALSNEYRSMLGSLAQTLQDNPTKSIELIGHSSIEGNDDANMVIALRRGQTVRRELIRMGAKPEQIRVRAEGNRKPLYYFQNEPWQEDYNRRVEIRWLDPALLPYEISAGLVQTEDLAIHDVAQWEERGVRAYYETILYQKQPAFRIKLWGFATQNEARTTARDLQRKFGGNLSLE